MVKMEGSIALFTQNIDDEVQGRDSSERDLETYLDDLEECLCPDEAIGDSLQAVLLDVQRLGTCGKCRASC